MAYRVEITNRALRDLSTLYRRVEADISVQSARWFGGLEKAILSLDRTPNRAPKTPEDNTLRQLLYGTRPHVYRIIYEVDPNTSTVYVLHIRSPRRDRIKRTPRRTR